MFNTGLDLVIKIGSYWNKEYLKDLEDVKENVNARNKAKLLGKNTYLSTTRGPELTLDNRQKIQRKGKMPWRRQGSRILRKLVTGAREIA